MPLGSISRVGMPFARAVKAVLFLGLCAWINAETASIQWQCDGGLVDGYRIYRGDAESRMFEMATTSCKASIGLNDGETLFVTSYRGVLESEPSGLLAFELEDSNDLHRWRRVSRADPSGGRYFTRFKVQSQAQPTGVMPSNAAILPPSPSQLGLNPASGALPEPGQTAFKALGINDLPTPWIIAHRGGWNVAPEHTMEAYRLSVASGIRFIEPDVQVLPDGTVVVMHDGTIDRTTNGSGSVSSQTAASWQTLFNDDGKRLPGWATNLKCPTFDDVLREFGNRVVIVPEAKNTGAGAAIVDKLQEFNIRKDMVIIQSPHISELAPAVAAGYPCMRMSSTNYAETIAAGIEFTGFGWYETDKIAAATAAGLKVIVWTIRRNIELETAAAAGAIAAFSDEPVYQEGMHRTSHDMYASKAFYHGDIRTSRVSLDGAESAIAISTRTWTSQDTVLLGWASPLHQPEDFVLDFSMKFTAVSEDAACGVIATQTSDRAISSDMPEDGKSSMNMIMRRDGRIELHVLDGAQAGPVAVSSDFPIPGQMMPLDEWVPYRLTVTPEDVTLERVGAGVAASIQNSQIRGAYLFAGSKQADVKFRSMTLNE